VSNFLSGTQVSTIFFNSIQVNPRVCRDYFTFLKILTDKLTPSRSQTPSYTLHKQWWSHQYGEVWRPPYLPLAEIPRKHTRHSAICESIPASDDVSGKKKHIAGLCWAFSLPFAVFPIGPKLNGPTLENCLSSGRTPPARSICSTAHASVPSPGAVQCFLVTHRLRPPATGT
jgi:hypothetical protein